MKLMKTEHIGVSVLMFLTLCPAAFPSPASSGQGLARDRGKGFTIALEAGLMRPADARFREIYGGGAFAPEVRISKGLGGGTSAWLAVSGFKRAGTVPVLEERTEARQTFLSLGAAYEKPVLGGLSGRVDAGLVLVAYREAALGIEAKGTRAGFRLGAGLSYPIVGKLSASASAGYIFSSGTRDGVSVRFGGLKAGLGLAYRFD